MAYSDYGAFVYKDGLRRPDKEDAPAFGGDEDILDFGNAQRIYVQIARQMEGQENQPWENISHGVLGDGPVRVSIHRTGVHACSVYVFDDEDESVKVYREEDFRAMCGVIPAEYPHLGEDATKEEMDEWDRKVHDYMAATDDGYDWSFEVGGAKVRFDWHPESTPLDEGAQFHASLVEADGSRWDGWYGSCYGAGWADSMAGNKVYDVLGEDGRPAPCKMLRISDAEFLYEGAVIDAVYDRARDRFLGLSYAVAYEDLDGAEPTVASTFADSSLSRRAYLDAQALADVLNMGISLAQQGYKSVMASGDHIVGEKRLMKDSYGAAFPDEELPDKWTGELLSKLVKAEFSLLPSEDGAVWEEPVEGVSEESGTDG